MPDPVGAISHVGQNSGAVSVAELFIGRVVEFATERILEIALEGMLDVILKGLLEFEGALDSLPKVPVEGGLRVALGLILEGVVDVEVDELGRAVGKPGRYLQVIT